MLDWSDLDESDSKLSEGLDGPPVILVGRGCRLTLKTLLDDERRNDNLLKRLYRLVQLMTDARQDGFSKEPRDGYTRVHGGEPPLYVRGSDQREVITTIGESMLTAPAPLLEQITALGVRALVEW